MEFHSRSQVKSQKGGTSILLPIALNSDEVFEVLEDMCIRAKICRCYDYLLLLRSIPCPPSTLRPNNFPTKGDTYRFIPGSRPS
jgi:hypothetical protein